MRWTIRILSGLVVMTFGYVWTVGQSGLTGVNQNLCDLWTDTFGPLLSCDFNILGCIFGAPVRQQQPYSYRVNFSNF
jgi:hypothetical protein